ncbi:hypothetical protein NUW54_g2304 [Trametes sanguinea]|uniref:Uncharacterized protein n=1 Tax=Trametes sanguinea TaxID=158606 RepID=A0ACC1Q6U6_9APHY|nr:hypothetical protein NUW54_g2304 [Trametes sanguinea]
MKISLPVRMLALSKASTYYSNRCFTGAPASKKPRTAVGPKEPAGTIDKPAAVQNPRQQAEGARNNNVTVPTRDEAAAGSPPSPRRNTAAAAIDVDAVDAQGFLQDIQLSALDNTIRGRREEKTRDIDHFFGSVSTENGKRVRACTICSKHKKVLLVAEVTTLRRHLQALHEGRYRNWAEKNDFESMLPKDTKARRERASEPTQGRLDEHLVEKPVRERTVRYTDDVFRQAALEWLVATDQPLQALEHPSFRNMVQIAAQATEGVKIPNRKQTRQAIVDLFKKNMTALRKRLNPLTRTFASASNTDGYFAVTAHWIEEKPEAAGLWQLETALLGFVQLNSAHHGERLGQALFKVVERVGIQHKVGYVTCDNASNNATMMKEFATHIKNATGQEYDPEERRVRCLAHIINLVRQALLASYSKSKHYDVTSPDADLVHTNGMLRDEVGLVRTLFCKAQGDLSEATGQRRCRSASPASAGQPELVVVRSRTACGPETLCVPMEAKAGSRDIDGKRVLPEYDVRASTLGFWSSSSLSERCCAQILRANVVRWLHKPAFWTLTGTHARADGEAFQRRASRERTERRLRVPPTISLRTCFLSLYSHFVHNPEMRIHALANLKVLVAIAITLVAVSVRALPAEETSAATEEADTVSPHIEAVWL